MYRRACARGLYCDPEFEFAVLDTYGYSSLEFFKGYGKPRPVDSKAVSLLRD